jgi:predicted dehydrogenase/threonine dehydrogenase-like Zn-dependent dehydrogenase
MPMKQVTQRLRDGRVEVLQVPRPVVSAGTVLVDVRASLLSAGTERTKVQTAKKSLVGKARQRPDQVAQVIEKARNDGIRETVRTVRARLEQPSVLGYSASGVAVAVGQDVRGIAVGDRVAVGGADAVHAEVDRVPANLCVHLPDAVSFEEGCFACVGSIALHGVRQAGVTLGERIAVVGLGLVGQLTALLLRAAGCTVIGIDLDRGPIERARGFGAIDFGFERGEIGDAVPPAAGGCDAVIVTAATPSNDPIELAPRLCRDRGRVVIVGDVGLALSRAPFYEKEIDLRLSRSYGPGRYDRAYEENGQDYPIGYVRWTEGRNMSAIVELIAAGRLPVRDLVTARFTVDDAPAAYERLSSDVHSPLGVIIEYEPSPEPTDEPAVGGRAAPPAGSPDRASLIGAGSFAQRVIVPGLRSAGFALDTVASASGVSARGLVEQAGEGEVGTPEEALASDAGLLVIATRHASHADLAGRGLRAGKAVFVEKPPCLSREELSLLRGTRGESGGLLAVGFNRRHAPLAVRLREHVAVAGHPLQVLIRVSAGPLPADHWLNDPSDGGGRLLGEGCHFVDLACWLVGAVPTMVHSVAQPLQDETVKTAGRFAISLGFPGGSLATILYGDGNATSVPKELVEAHGGGRSGILDDFRSLRLFDGRAEKKLGGRRQDKGHAEQFKHLRGRLTASQPQPEELDPLATMAATLTALESAGQDGPSY